MTNKTNETLAQKAQRIATKLHKGQYRKDGVTPYIRHPEAVVKILIEAGVNDEIIIVSAWLHDAVEDCDVSIESIKDEFGSEVARVVSTLTRDCNREDYKKRIKESDFAVKIIKLADVVHNCYDLSNPNLPEKTRLNKIKDCQDFYLDLAKKVSVLLYNKLYSRTHEFLKIYSLKGGDL